MGPSVLFLPGYGESNPYQEQLGRALRQRGFRVTSSSGGGPFPVVTAFVRHGRPDTVHFHWLHPYLIGRGPLTSVLKGTRTIVELIVLRTLGVSLVWTVHNLLEHHRRSPRVEAFFKRLVVRLVRGCIVHCESGRTAVINRFHVPPRHRSKLTVIPHGHYIDWYPNTVSAAATRRTLDLDEDETVFLHLGRLEPYKDIPGLIEAFQSADVDRSRLLIVGKPGNEAIAESIVRSAAGDRRIRLDLRYVPDVVVQRYLNAADAVVLPYRDVLSSGSAVLAASFRRAIIAPRTGCIADRFEDGHGLLYDPLARDLAWALDRAVESDLDRIGERNFERVSDPDWQSIATATAAVYGLERRDRSATGG